MWVILTNNYNVARNNGATNAEDAVFRYDEVHIVESTYLMHGDTVLADYHFGIDRWVSNDADGNRRFQRIVFRPL